MLLTPRASFLFLAYLKSPRLLMTDSYPTTQSILHYTSPNFRRVLLSYKYLEPFSMGLFPLTLARSVQTAITYLNPSYHGII
jgi:hypothetical protein